MPDNIVEAAQGGAEPLSADQAQEHICGFRDCKCSDKLETHSLETHSLCSGQSMGPLCHAKDYPRPSQHSARIHEYILYYWDLFLWIGPR